jgi:hypothetical protein
MKHLILLLVLVSTARAQAQAPVDVRFLDWASVDPAAVCAQMQTADAATIHSLRRAANFQVMNGMEGAMPAQAILECLDAHGIDAQVISPDMASKIRAPKGAAKKPSAPKRRSSAPAPAAGR